MENQELRYVLNSLGLVINKMYFSTFIKNGDESYIEKLQSFPPKLISYF